jgi:thiol:disulfide interchange protein DsbD
MILLVMMAFMQALPCNCPIVIGQAALAQSNQAKAAPAIPKVTAKLVSNCKQISAGQPFKLGVQLLMPPGWHTYYKVSGDAGMPTSIDWHLPPGFKAGEIEWQKPNKFSDSGITTYGYQDKTLLAATITPPVNLPAGQDLDFSASIRWLQCKDLCVPGKAEVSLKLPVADKADADPTYAEDFATVGFIGDVGAGEKAGQPTTVSILSEKLTVQGAPAHPLNLLSYLFFAFVGGFILNFMPCVLPVISIKILGFVQQAGENPKRVFQLGLTFTAGILSSFLFLAGIVLLLQQTGQEVGWGFQFQHPAFVIVMSVIVLLFALSLFGLFYISPPPGQSAIDKVASKEGAGGTFFKGVLATTLSTPCTAPFLGTAVGFAFTEPWWVIMLIFLVVGLGMAFPYLVLTAKPGWMKFIPKPGAWMEKFKQSLGFLLLATVVWLLRILGAQVGFEQALWVSAFLVIISFAVWVVSSFTDLASSERRVWTMRIVALVLVGAGYYFCIATVPGLGLPAPERKRASAIEQATGAIDWQPFTVAALDGQIAAGKTVFLDFTAEWCLTCKVNEQAVIDTKPVVEKLKALNVVTMKADWTRQDPQISNLLHKFGRSGVPLYVIFPAGRPQQPIVLPEVITTQIVLDGLDRAGPSKN